MKRLAKLLATDRVIRLDGADKPEALKRLIAVLAKSPQVQDPRGLDRAIHEREAIMSTGIGQGIAIPHARLGSVSDFVAAVGVSREGIDFDAFDDEPVHIVVMIAGPERQREYLQILARVTLALKREENRRRLVEAQSGAEFLSILQGAPEGPDR